MFRLAILLLATSGCCFAQQGRGGQIKIPEDENQIDSTTTPKSTTEKRTTTPKPTTEKRTTTPKPTTQAKKILSSEEIIDLVNKYRAKLVKEEIPEAEVMFEVMSFTIDPVAQEHINRKTLVDWIRITGLRIPRRTSFDQLLQDFSTKIVEYPEDKPNAFSWPVQAGATQTGPAIRARVTYDFWKFFMRTGRKNLENYNRANGTDIRISKEKTKLLQEKESLALYVRRETREVLKKVGSKVEVNIVKGLIRFGNEQPMSATTAAIKLNVDMTKWNGSKLEDLLTLQEKKDLEAGKLTYGSIRIDGVKENTCTTSNEPTDDIGPNTPKRKRTLSDYIKTKYPEDKPNAFSWPVQAGATQTGPAIRARVTYDFWKFFMRTGRKNLENYNRANGTDIRISKEKTKLLQEKESLALYVRRETREVLKKVGSKVEVNIVKGLIRFGNEQPMSATTAAIKLNVDMTKWNGSKLEDLLTLQEKKDLEIFYYKSTRAYCFMRLKSCLVRTNVWHNKVACVFNNGPDAREQLYIPNSRGKESGKGCAGNDAVCQLAINNPASWCNRKNGLCVAAEGVTFPRTPTIWFKANTFENFFSKTESTKNSLDYGSPYCSTDNCTVHISSDNYDNHNSHNDHNTYDNYNNHLYYSHGS
ncbi:hypothetical protein Q1695_008203 [Nippostrongylus brasiliensis]|nr:hypothetical protein Q1695_008203 [Nippostrongylus brasiliensis]